MNAPTLPPTHAFAVRVGLRGALLREAKKLIVQAELMRAELERDAAQLTPRDAADVRSDLGAQDSDLLDALFDDEPVPPLPQPTDPVSHAS